MMTHTSGMMTVTGTLKRGPFSMQATSNPTTWVMTSLKIIFSTRMIRSHCYIRIVIVIVAIDADACVVNIFQIKKTN